MLNFIIVGLVCNVLGCYWVHVDDRAVFTDQTICVYAAADGKAKSVMYFDTACMVKE